MRAQRGCGLVSIRFKLGRALSRHGQRIPPGSLDERMGIPAGSEELIVSFVKQTGRPHPHSADLLRIRSPAERSPADGLRREAPPPRATRHQSSARWDLANSRATNLASRKRSTANSDGLPPRLSRKCPAGDSRRAPAAQFPVRSPPVGWTRTRIRHEPGLRIISSRQFRATSD